MSFGGMLRTSRWSHSKTSRDGTVIAARRRFLMVHDLVLSFVFLSMVVAPALIAMRADNGEQDF